MLEEEPVLQTDRNQISPQGHVSLSSDVPLFAHEQFHWMVSQIAIPTSEQEQELVEQVDKVLLVVENPVDYLCSGSDRCQSAIRAYSLNKNYGVFFPCFVGRDRPASWLDYLRVALAGRVAHNMAETACGGVLDH